MSWQGTFDLLRLFRAFGYSFQGLRAAFAHEAAFRQEVILSLVLIPLGLWLGATGLERALLTGSVILVMIVELLNSGIEAVVDRLGMNRMNSPGAPRTSAPPRCCSLWSMCLSSGR